MRLVVFAFGLFGTAALAIVGAAWLIIMLAPAGVLLWIVVLFIVRNSRRRAAMADRLTRDADRERELNQQEYEAWRGSVADARHRDNKRLRALRKFDSTRHSR